MAILMSMVISFVPASAAVDARSGDTRYNIMLVIDASGSLVDNRVNGVRKPGADPSGMRYELLQDLLGTLEDDGHYIGAIVFSGSKLYSTEDKHMETGILMQTDMLPLDEAAPDGGPVKDYVFREIKNTGVDGSYNGTTDIGTALLVAERKLQAIQKENGLESLVFLFADGITDLYHHAPAEEKSRENMQTATREMSANGIRLFGAFLNNQGKIKSDEISDAVCAANGVGKDSEVFKKSYVEITDAASCHRAVTVLLQFLGYVGSEPPEPITGTIEDTFTIPGVGVEEFNIRLYSYAGEDLPEMTVVLTMPDGTELKGTKLDDMCRSSRTVRTYKIPKPMSGQWNLKVTVPEDNTIAYVYDKVYSLVIGSSIAVSPDVADLHVNGTASFTATLTQRGTTVTDPYAYEGYECRLDIMDHRTNQVTPYIIDNNNGVFTYDLLLQEYGRYSARIVFACDGFEVPSSYIPYELINHEPQITGTVNRTVKYGPMQDKTTEVDLTGYINDVEDGRNLTITLVDTDCDEDGFEIQDGVLTLTNAVVGSGEIILSITDSQGAGGEMKVIIEAKNTLPIFIAIIVAILILIVVIVILVIRGRQKMNLKGDLSVSLGLEIEAEKSIDLDLQVPGREAANNTNLKTLLMNALVNEADRVKPGITCGMVKNALAPYLGGLEKITLSKVMTRDAGKRSAGIRIKQAGKTYVMPGKRMVDLYVDDMSVSLIYSQPMDENDDVFGTDDMDMSRGRKSKKDEKKRENVSDFDDDLF